MIKTLVRVGVLVLAIAIIALALYGIVGKPSLARLYNQNEIGRFQPTFGHGIGQFLGETFLVAIVAFIARKWLGVRL
jgi:hypothetical protein